MNYLAHLFFSQPNKYSLTGNLMGDFLKGVDTTKLPKPIINGIKNHKLVDKYTDNHDVVKGLKVHLSPARKRFSAVISDVVFDHFLITHWQKFANVDFDEFVENSYYQLTLTTTFMPERMRLVVERMRNENWLASYQDIKIIGKALDGIANRIRFENTLHGVITEVEHNYDAYELAFLQFFPELCRHVKDKSLEQGFGGEGAV